MILGGAPVRGLDRHGSGAWGASRDGGRRTHKGVDYAFWPGSTLLSPVTGEVTKLGYAYGDDLRWRYVEITDGPRRYRFFYAQPIIAVGATVFEGDRLGVVQDLRERYPGITPHVHVSMWRDEHRVNPELEMPNG